MENMNNKTKKIAVIAIISIIIIMAIIIIVFTSNNNKTELQNQEVKESEQSNPPSSDTNSQTNNETVLEETYRVAITNTYVNVPNYHKMEMGLTEGFMDGTTKFFAISCSPFDKASDDVKEEYNKRITDYIADVHNHRLVKALGEHTEEIININGIETYKVEGKMNCGSNPKYDAYFVSYTFIMDNVSFMISGLVYDESQPEKEIKQVKEITEAMMRSVRDHK